MYGKYSFQKDWYKSQRLLALIVTVILLVANDMFGKHLDETTVTYIVSTAVAFIVGKSVQDAVAAHAEVKGAALIEVAKTVPPSP